MVSFSKLAIALGCVVSNVLAAPAAPAQSGDMTWYTPGLGSCGWTNGEGDMIVAMSPSEKKCGTHIVIKYKGKTANAKIVDTCPGCAAGSIDVSPTVFKIFEPLDKGRIKVEWHYV